MKRFGMYNNDFNNLFECYAKVNKQLVVESLPSETRKATTISTGDSYPGLKQIKIFIQKPGRGADLTNIINVKSIDSDNGNGGAIISGDENDRTFHLVTTDKNAQVKTIDQQGTLENDFVTNVAPKFDQSKGELSIIHVEHL